jgi:hypothetical protein
VSAQPLYIATLVDRDGDAVHLDFLAGGTGREAQRWAELVLIGLAREIGRSAKLVEFAISGDRAPVYGVACPVEDAVSVCAEYLRRLEDEDTRPVAVAS